MIKFTAEQGIARVTLARVDKQNALNMLMFMQLNKIIKTIKKDKSIKLVVITGEGEHFSSGLDIKSVMDKPINIFKLLFKWLPGNQNLAQTVVLGWQSIQVPVIAHIKGNCLGAGLQIALGADYRIAHSEAKLAIMEARWGLCPDMGANVLLSGLMKRDQALWLASHATTVSANEALKLGLITQVSDNSNESVDRMITTLLSRSPDTLAAIKRVTQLSFKSQTRKILATETYSQIRLLLNPNTKKAIANAKNKNLQKYANAKTW
ncbi:crotonase/enoyl-CoA hydratase family protein [Pseudoalteromonas sp. MMG010]|uniref:crotonase/enoyl-CoA hydratase family protein n=1 Tax=Pseudoalteromonas sp. MMG010 TaxID=2822685 RepID=UPI001B3A2331|nr:crotonase/enoyl-CoA hydratase family protein [Pseudoalteromonas sp. MMG010]MBQ4831941.1 crotonase/enoyl-CoA hydratase family protein [Pseudoalteromonas sp. MMG010]